LWRYHGLSPWGSMQTVFLRGKIPEGGNST
jgi:hypothetical protein